MEDVTDFLWMGRRAHIGQAEGRPVCVVLAEAEVLVREIDWEVVPGVSAGIAVPAYAGIPVTHRGICSSVAFVTGHEDPLKQASTVRWDYLAKGVDTIVVFMGVSRIGEIAADLIEHGRPGETPVAIIRWGT